LHVVGRHRFNSLSLPRTDILNSAAAAAAAAAAAVFTLFTSIALWLDSRFTSHSGSSEAYTTAGRAVKAGLTACDIVSEYSYCQLLCFRLDLPVLWYFVA
jgi:hypothetical protein